MTLANQRRNKAKTLIANYSSNPRSSTFDGGENKLFMLRLGFAMASVI
jgi:hypothetical protein